MLKVTSYELHLKVEPLIRRSQLPLLGTERVQALRDRPLHLQTLLVEGV